MGGEGVVGGTDDVDGVDEDAGGEVVVVDFVEDVEEEDEDVVFLSVVDGGGCVKVEDLDVVFFSSSGHSVVKPACRKVVSWKARSRSGRSSPTVAEDFEEAVTAEVGTLTLATPDDVRGPACEDEEDDDEPEAPEAGAGAGGET